MFKRVGSFVALALLSAQVYAQASAPMDPRYCVTAPVRASDGRIARSKAVLREFKALHPCPSTGSSTGTCPGWAIDHVVPLDCGGCDAVVNLQWLPNEIKSASGPSPKDRWERIVYCRKEAPHAPAPRASATGP